MPADAFFDPFSAKSFLTFPPLENANINAWHGFKIDPDLESEVFTLVDPQDPQLAELQPGILKLEEVPPFPSLGDGHKNNTLSQKEGEGEAEGSADKGRTLSSHESDESEDDVWKLADVQRRKTKVGLISWDHFLDAQHQEPSQIYLSETSKEAFEAVLARSLPPSTKYVKQDVLLSALFDLGLGRNSAFFKWSDANGSFRRSVDNYVISGMSSKPLHMLIDEFLGAGTQVWQLRAYSRPRLISDAVLVAFAAAITTVLNVVQEHVECERRRTLTTVQLRELFHRPFTIVRYLCGVLDNIRAAKHAAEVFASLLSWAEYVALDMPELEHLVDLILVKTLKPVFRDLNIQLGFTNDSQVPTSPINDLATILSRKIIDTLKSSREALTYMTDLSETDILTKWSADKPTHLKLVFTWDQIIEIRQEADQYEQEMREFMPSCIEEEEQAFVDALSDPVPVADIPVPPSSTFVFESELFTGKGVSPWPLQEEIRDEISTATRSFLRGHEDLANLPPIPCRQALALSFTPLLTVRHRLVSYSVLRSLFLRHNVLDHLRVLCRFQLLTDGNFSSRLSAALFDSEQISSEGARGSNATTGLRLQSRETWPPASSELRLVLIDILSNSMSSTKNNDDATLTQAMSFAIRELSDEDLERCRDVNSIYALDFLRLHYKAPNTLLESVITAKALKNYDRTFMFLLRLLRLKDLSQHLLRLACTRHQSREGIKSNREHKFRLEIQHFVSSLANYAQNLAIGTIWHVFESELQKVHQRVMADDYDGVLSLVGSLDDLRTMHEQTLNEINHALLMKKKQIHGRILLEEIFAIVLRFAAVLLLHERRSQSATNRDDDGDGDDIHAATTIKISRLHEEFKTKVAGFVGYLRMTVDQNVGISSGTSESSSAYDHGRISSSSVSGGNVMLEQLLLCVDFNGYYSKMTTMTTTSR